MARKKKSNWRSEKGWPILPVDAECLCPKRGGGIITLQLCKKCKYLAGVSYPLGFVATIRCNHKNQEKAWRSWLARGKKDE